GSADPHGVLSDLKEGHGAGREGHPDPLLVRYHRIAKLFANWFFAIFFYFFIIGFLYIPFGSYLSDTASLMISDVSIVCYLDARTSFPEGGVTMTGKIGSVKANLHGNGMKLECGHFNFQQCDGNEPAPLQSIFEQLLLRFTAS
ncbi:unnamed protein product, partial [Prorocentrum cordatum]